MDQDSDNLIASIPYKNGKSIDFYEDRIILKNKEIYYDDISGYSFLLKSFQQSVYFIPIFNVRSVTFCISTGNDKKAVTFLRELLMPLWFHSRKQLDLDVVFSEVFKLSDALIAEHVLNKLMNQISDGESINIGGLIINKEYVKTQGAFKEKKLQNYGRTYMSEGSVIVEDDQGRMFFSTSLGTINAPLLQPVLDAVKG